MSRSDASPETPPVGAPVDAARDAKADAPRPLYRDFTLRILPTPAVQRREFGLMDADGLDAEDAAEDAAESAPIAVAISSEAPVERWDWMTGERYYEVLDHTAKGGPDLSYAADGLPFCLDHDLCRQIGLLDGLSLDGDRMLRGVITPGSHPDAPWVFADMRDGIRKKVSIGYLPGEVLRRDPRRAKLEAQLEDLDREARELTDRNAQLVRQIRALQTDVGAIEDRARSDLGILYPNELVIRVQGVKP